MVKKKPAAAAPSRRVVAEARPRQVAEAAPVVAAPPLEQRWTKCLRQRRRRGADVPGGLVYDKGVFDNVAKLAVDEAPGYMRRMMSYPLPLLGEFGCTVGGYRGDLDGLRSTSWV